MSILEHAVLSDPSDPKRVAFELWCQVDHKFGCDRGPDGDYVEPETRAEWDACTQLEDGSYAVRGGFSIMGTHGALITE